MQIQICGYGSIPKPPPNADPNLIASWQCVNDIVHSWLIYSISKEIVATMVYAGSAVALWNFLREMYSHGNGPGIFQLKHNFLSLTQDNLFVIHYFGKVKTLWEELGCYRPVLDCNCGDSRSFQDFLQLEYVFYFLMGLDESFYTL